MPDEIWLSEEEEQALLEGHWQLGDERRRKPAEHTPPSADTRTPAGRDENALPPSPAPADA